MQGLTFSRNYRGVENMLPQGNGGVHADLARLNGYVSVNSALIFSGHE